MLIEGRMRRGRRTRQANDTCWRLFLARLVFSPYSCAMSTSRSNRSAAVLGPMRIPFLTLVPACVVTGVATAFHDGHAIRWLDVVVAFIGALATHISVNALNEYDDFKSGLDFKTERTPFSGGSGVLPQDPARGRFALITGLTALAVTIAVGIFFIARWGWAILPLGLLGILTIVLYTRWLTRSPLLCLVAPGFGFGLCMVMGTHFVLTGQYSWTAFFASLVPFFLVSNLLLLNQFPDANADKAVGRQHLIIAHGKEAAVRTYGLFILFTYLSIALGVVLSRLPWTALLGLLTVILAIPLYRGVTKRYESIPELIPHLGQNVILTLATPILVAVGIFLAGSGS